ncbi:serine/threonine-protein kinase [Nocardiopsis sp. CNT312]|uniref:serine/threonine protein kinase n=1 Tax=Nocardiopsis sp. CNT312 TaxID=1137268 RepID=UPI001E428AC1|nr:protein kinase [Nocardiopsis sp. CNT312]
MRTLGALDSSDPQRVGRYRLINRLGAGGMGQVYLGRSAAGRAVAVKRIHPHMAADPSFRARFAREVTAARQVSGAFTAPVIDAGPDDEVPWLVTSYVPSLALDEAVQNHGPLPEASVRVLAAGLAEALAEIHRVGLIHRDLKPGNVLLAEDGPRVIDFGIARATDGTAATQSVIGTPGFMSPEQVQGEALTPASDLFAYGAVLAFAATGTGPFGEGAMPTMVMRIISREPDLDAVPESLRHLVAACLSKKPSGRPGPGEILDYLGDVHGGTSWLPPAVMAGVRDQVTRVDQALAASAGEAHESADQRTEVLGNAGPGTRAFGDRATRVAPGDGGSPRTRRMPTEPPPAAAHGQGPIPGPATGGPAFPGTGAQSPPTARYGPATAHPHAPEPPGVPLRQEDPYADLYGGPRAADPRGYQEAEERALAERRMAQQREEDQRRQHEEQLRRQEEQRLRHEEQQRRRQEDRRQQEAERVHRERMRAEQQAAQRAQSEARMAHQPGVWGFVKLLPLMVLPLVQIPLGYGAALGWSWLTTDTGLWTGEPYHFEALNWDSFWHATMLGYFLFNNLVSGEFLVRSLRTSFVTGSVLALGAIAATNGLLATFGFWS